MVTPNERLVAGMKCGEVLALLSDFLDGDASPATRDQIIAHLRGCDWCATFGGRFSAVIESLRRELRDAAPLDADVTARLLARLTKEQK
jgi:anti-sigma factor RsiW